MDDGTWRQVAAFQISFQGEDATWVMMELNLEHCGKAASQIPGNLFWGFGCLAMMSVSILLLLANGNPIDHV